MEEANPLADDSIGVYGCVLLGGMTMGETKTILCGNCHVAVEQRVDPNGNTTVVCPNCRQNDTVENAVREAGEHLIDKTMRQAFAGFDSPGMTVTQPPQRNYRFIMGD
jgi:hypothetical protein